MRRASFVIGTFLAGLASWPAAADEGAAGERAAEHARYFETNVRPILAARCFRCHGEEKQKGDLRLDSREALMSGGYSGPAVVPGKPDESLLFSAVGYADESLQMPPSDKLPDREIAHLRHWIEQGASVPGRGRGAVRCRTRLLGVSAAARAGAA